jgi:hypothetical protein
VTPLSAERLQERGRALGAWEAAGGRLAPLLRLERRVRSGRVTDWPTRAAGEPERRVRPPADPGEAG